MNLKAIFFFAGFFILILNKFMKENEEAIVWQEGRSLTWDDFKGKPARRNSVASTSYEIVKEVKYHGNTANVSIRSLFFPYLSWKRNGRNDEDILKHEQGHFDIAEIFARKLRSKVKLIKCESQTELEPMLRSLAVECDEAMDKFQDTYDRETDHSRNGDVQRKWNDSLKKELERSYVDRLQTVTVHFNEAATEKIEAKGR
jgi:hypothetical protein